jgi:hypothetical protein
LQIADSAKKKEQIQLKLVVENAMLPVSKDSALYSSVTNAWIRAMTAMNNLILGRPQRIQSGDIVLGLLSWHLYPDIAVLGIGNKSYHISQHDKIIAPGGIITLGMQSREGDIDEGIFWSLPLAHMRFYGDKVTTERRIGLRQSQIPFSDFRYVILGSVLSSWGLMNDQFDTAFRLIILLGNAPDDHSKDSSRGSDHSLPWLKSLVQSCEKFQRSSDLEQKYRRTLISFGRRRCSNFLAEPLAHPLPAFDLTNVRFLMNSANSSTDDKVASRLEFLRRWARITSDRLRLREAVIRYKLEPGEDHIPSLVAPGFFCTSVFAPDMQPGKRKRRLEHPVYGNQHHLHWRAESNIDSVEVPRNFDYDPSPGDGNAVDPSYFRRVSGLQDHGIIELPPGLGKKKIKYEFVCGDPSMAAIYRPVEPNRPHQLSRNAMSLAELLHFLEKGYVEASRLIAKLRKKAYPACYTTYFESLESLYCVEEIYSGLKSACVNLRLTCRPVPKSHWASLFKGPMKGSSVSPVARALSCIAFFETGELELDPLQLEGVLALSHNNSIFVAAQLLEDPTEKNLRFPVKRLIGNIGRPGLALLIPPQKPRMLEYDFNKYVVEHEPFNGELLDNFEATSLHLSFTGYELPMDVEPRGNRDSEACIIETVISVFDGGEWVGDLDIMKAERGWWHSTTCTHDAEERKRRSHLPARMQAVDSWKAFLDAPSGIGVFRAHGNAMARLAAATLAAQKAYAYHILPPNGCWACVDENIFPRIPTHIGTLREPDGHAELTEDLKNDTRNSESRSSQSDEDDDGEDSFSSVDSEIASLPKIVESFCADMDMDLADSNSLELFPELDFNLGPPQEQPSRHHEFQVDVMFIC